MSSVLSAILCGILILSLFLPPILGGEDECIYTLTNVPYISFNGERLPDHSYLDIRRLGDAANGSNVLQCHTDLETCCGDSEDMQHTGEWILPNGLVVGPSDARFNVRILSQRIDLAYSAPNSPTSQDTGIFRCSVPTNAINDIGNTARESVYIGLYKGDGMYIILLRPFQRGYTILKHGKKFTMIHNKFAYFIHCSYTCIRLSHSDHPDLKKKRQNLATTFFAKITCLSLTKL